MPGGCRGTSGVLGEEVLIVTELDEPAAASPSFGEPGPRLSEDVLGF
jgi:hypothetical protein